MTRIRRAQERHAHPELASAQPMVSPAHERVFGAQWVSTVSAVAGNGAAGPVTGAVGGAGLLAVPHWAPSYSQVGIATAHCHMALHDVGRLVPGEVSWVLRLLFAGAGALPNGSIALAPGGPQWGNPTPVNRNLDTNPNYPMIDYGFVDAVGVAVEGGELYWVEWPPTLVPVPPNTPTGLRADPSDVYELVMESKAGAGRLWGTLRNLTAGTESVHVFEPGALPPGPLGLLLAGWWHSSTTPMRCAGPVVVAENLWSVVLPDIDGAAPPTWPGWPPSPLPGAGDADDVDCGPPEGAGWVLDVECGGALR